MAPVFWSLFSRVLWSHFSFLEFIYFLRAAGQAREAREAREAQTELNVKSLSVLLLSKCPNEKHVTRRFIWHGNKNQEVLIHEHSAKLHFTNHCTENKRFIQIIITSNMWRSTRLRYFHFTLVTFRGNTFIFTSLQWQASVLHTPLCEVQVKVLWVFSLWGSVKSCFRPGLDPSLVLVMPTLDLG